MYYNRTLSPAFAQLLEANGPLHWLFEYVKSHEELDFLIGKNDDGEWISVYRGLSRILSIRPCSKNLYKLEADPAYMDMNPNAYDQKLLNIQELNALVQKIKDNPTKFDRYYENRKEGYYQNKFSRQFGISGSPEDPFVIVDKEAVIGYQDTAEKEKVFGYIQKEYKELQALVSDTDESRYGKDLETKSLGGELDFLALDKHGNILLIEYKHGTNTSGIYLSPLQVGFYYDLFTKVLDKVSLSQAVLEMVAQKQKIGLINPEWKAPKEIKDIIPVLVISEYNYKSTARQKFYEVLEIVRGVKGSYFLSDIRTYDYVGEELRVW